MKRFLLTLCLSLSLYGQMISDISNIVGIRDNQLIGHGLVVGLKKGDGDKNDITKQMLTNLMRNSFVKITANSADSAATVTVTATLPAFTRQGDKIKVNISSIAGAKSLDGGQLLLTQLKGIDGKVYAIAQGKITSNEKGATGYIYEGAIVENEVDYDLKDEKYITLSLIKANAKIAALAQDKINEKFEKEIAYAIDTRTIEVSKPANMSIVRFISQVQNINLDTMMKNKVIIDPVKEIIVAGSDITINPVTVSRKNFTLRIKKSDLNDKEWEDPAKNVGVNIGDNVNIGQEPVNVNLDNSLINTKRQPTVSDLMRAMKVMKLSITEIIETIKMLDDLGAINADVEMVR